MGAPLEIKSPSLAPTSGFNTASGGSDQDFIIIKTNGALL